MCEVIYLAKCLAKGIQYSKVIKCVTFSSLSIEPKNCKLNFEA